MPHGCVWPRGSSRADGRRDGRLWRGLGCDRGFGRAAGVGRSRDGDFGIARVVWVATGYYCRTGVGTVRHSRRCRGALARDRRSGFLQGVLALSACEVPVLVVAACSVFSQRAVMGGLVAALVATYTLTWFLLAMGFAFELPVSAPRRTKAQMATPLAGGAAAARTFGGPVEVSSDSISTTKEA